MQIWRHKLNLPGIQSSCKTRRQNKCFIENQFHIITMKADIYLKSGSTLRLGWLAVLFKYLSRAARLFSTNSAKRICIKNNQSCWCLFDTREAHLTDWMPRPPWTSWLWSSRWLTCQDREEWCDRSGDTSRTVCPADPGSHWTFCSPRGCSSWSRTGWSWSWLCTPWRRTSPPPPCGDSSPRSQWTRLLSPAPSSPPPAQYFSCK